MTRSYSRTFDAPPSIWGLYPRVLAARKPGRVPEGVRVPRLEARLTRVRIDASHLQRYREICGCAAAEELPIAYPHVLANGLHLALLASKVFPVTPFGLVHVANHIEQLVPLGPEGGGELSCWLDGHEQTSRGQLFAMHTEWRIAGEVVWRERCEFLARAGRAAPAAAARRAALAASEADASVVAESTLEEEPATSTSFRADAGLGRRYGQVSGDLNPIHVADLTARLFGFRAAIAHGMWSLARCAAELDAAVPASAPRQLEVQFRRPVFLPSWLSLRSARDAAGVRFVLLDSQGEKLHLVGSLRRAA